MTLERGSRARIVCILLGVPGGTILVLFGIMVFISVNWEWWLALPGEHTHEIIPYFLFVVVPASSAGIAIWWANHERLFASSTRRARVQRTLVELGAQYSRVLLSEIAPRANVRTALARDLTRDLLVTGEVPGEYDPTHDAVEFTIAMEELDALQREMAAWHGKDTRKRTEGANTRR